jgi:eukaryotic-like serine/threonine-protein kinase
MVSERWEQIKNLLHKAMQLAPEPRARFLDETCSADASLRVELESLLLAEGQVPSQFLQQLPAGAEAVAPWDRIDSASAALETGQLFANNFRLMRRLGEGGMGQVWLAVQVSPVQRQVALKLIKAGMYDEAVVQRFQSERQSLAIMDHPAIAKVFDAGTTSQGQPYFVMEYVPGLPITEYCDLRKLSIAERLQLFIQACDAVQHAHRKAIIHRDLKPPNILVVEVDGRPVPRIIDFGLAKALPPAGTAPAAGQSLFTQLGHFVGTPGYMSPEQIDLNVQDIDTRTDVYSLGVVLYVLLTGLQPFETRARQKPPIDELLRQLRQEEPPTPSAKTSSDREGAAATATARSATPGQLVGLLRGDLDGIAMKALEKDRARRYGAPSELAADIRRYLNHEPVMARPASAGYHLRKYLRRHRVAMGTLAGLLLLLTAFSLLQSVELRRTTQERDRANRITDFMTGMFKVADPNEARGNSVTAREILDKASAEMQDGLAKDPEVQSQMMQVMATTYLNLGLYARAHELSKRALDAQLRLLGPDNPKTLASMTQLGWILNREGQNEEAEKVERQALASERRILGTENPLTLETMDHLAVIEQGRGQFSEEEALEREVIKIGSRTLGAENEQILRAMNNLGLALIYQSRYAEGEQVFRRLVEAAPRAWGPDHPRTLTALGNLALAIQLQGRLSEAEPLYRENLAARRRVLGSEHPNTTVVMDALADLLSEEGHLDEAEVLLREAVANRLHALGPEHIDTLRSENNLADVLAKQGRALEAEALQRQALATELRSAGAQNPITLVGQSGLARILLTEGRRAEAEQLARETLEAQQRSLGPLHTDTLNTLQVLGTAMALDHRYAEASKLFRDVIDQAGQSAGQGNLWEAWYAFACVALAAGQSDDALLYLREAISRGYTNAESLAADGDLKSLHPNPKFQQLLAELRLPPASVKPP